MNINDSLKKASLPAVTTPTTAQPRSSERANNATKNNIASTESNEDSVQLSSQYQSTISDKDNFDAEKVEKIKSAIASGQYAIHPEKIAAGLLNTVQDLLSIQK